MRSRRGRPCTLFLFRMSLTERGNLPRLCFERARADVGRGPGAHAPQNCATELNRTLQRGDRAGECPHGPRKQRSSVATLTAFVFNPTCYRHSAPSAIPLRLTAVRLTEADSSFSGSRTAVSERARRGRRGCCGAEPSRQRLEVIMFESLVSRLTSPPVARRRHTVHSAREVCSEPEEEAAPAQRRSRPAKQLLDKRRKARLSCADLTAAAGAEPERISRIDAIKAFLPLRQSKSLGRLDGLKESERQCNLRVAPMRARRSDLAHLSCPSPHSTPPNRSYTSDAPYAPEIYSQIYERQKSISE
ncbi:hypothetical protein EVAR_95744_1 [Eumeta japonica]|uniref:Uncharacterized protein n=1 Tax=Eumeta variegata TaxID=151549 RepID=A0A4C1UKI2_EUMVA|nr:hypothetical protein EVAR_95744_1 [Eumeta japonica]